MSLELGKNCSSFVNAAKQRSRAPASTYRTERYQPVILIHVIMVDLAASAALEIRRSFALNITSGEIE
jgi:hypothetical protein